MYELASIYTATDLRTVVNGAGSYFFSPGAMSGFNSRLLDGLWALDGNEAKPGARFLFLTSEQFVASDGTAAPRTYKVRHLTLKVSDDGAPGVYIETLSEVGSAEAAKTAANSFAYLSTPMTEESA